MGDGSLKTQNSAELIDLIQTVQEIEIENLMRYQDYISIDGFFSNQNLTEGFYWREFGIFANDPDKGEILLYYANAGDLAEYITSAAVGEIVKKLRASIAVSETQNVTIKVNDSLIWATHEDVKAYVDAIALTRKTIDILIPVSAWQRDEGAETRYIYYADVVNESISADAVPDVALDIKSLETACDCGLCPTVQTYEAGMLRFYAEELPRQEITGSCTLYRQGDGSPVPDFGGSTSLPIASATTLGGVKVGSGLVIAEDGTLSADTGADTEIDRMIEEIYSQPGSGETVDNIASDEAVQDMIEEVYGQSDTGIEEGDIATDAEVDEMIEDIYGKEV